MNTELEQLLTQELRQVADDVRVPAMPSVTETPSRPSYPWLPLLVAAVIATIVAGAMLLVPEGRGHRETPPVETPKGLSTDRPTVPYIEGGVLADGKFRLEGKWHSLSARGDSWVAVRKDAGGDDNKVPAWYWDLKPGEPAELSGADQVVLSANGKYAAAITPLDPGRARLQVFETRIGGEGVGARDFPSGGVDEDNRVQLVGLTDNGVVILSSVAWKAPRIWDPESQRLIDLSRTAPGQFASRDSDAGPVFTDGPGGRAYVADVDASGRVTRRVDLPNELVLPNHAATRGLAEAQESTSVGDMVLWDSVLVHDLSRGGVHAVRAPDGWRFMSFSWETDDLFLGAVRDEAGGERTARCSAKARRCLLLPRMGTFAEDKKGNTQAASVSSAPPEVPYVSKNVLHVDGQVVPGRWDNVQVHGDAWTALRADGTAWAGIDPEPMEVSGEVEGLMLSPSGAYLVVMRSSGGPTLQVAETRRGGQGVGTLDTDLGAPLGGDRIGIAGITNDGLVVLEHPQASPELWNPWTGRRTDLGTTAPGQQPAGSSQAGMAWVDLPEGDTYLGEVQADGTVTRGPALPDRARPNPSASWYLEDDPTAKVTDDALGAKTLVARQLGGRGEVWLSAPRGWYFAQQVWENDDQFVALMADKDLKRGRARCSVEIRRCVPIVGD